MGWEIVAAQGTGSRSWRLRDTLFSTTQRNGEAGEGAWTDRPNRSRNQCTNRAHPHPTTTRRTSQARASAALLRSFPGPTTKPPPSPPPCARSSPSCSRRWRAAPRPASAARDTTCTSSRRCVVGVHAGMGSVAWDRCGLGIVGPGRGASRSGTAAAGHRCD